MLVNVNNRVFLLACSVWVKMWNALLCLAIRSPLNTCVCMLIVIGTCVYVVVTT